MHAYNIRVLNWYMKVGVAKHISDDCEYEK